MGLLPLTFQHLRYTNSGAMGTGTADHLTLLRLFGLNSALRQEPASSLLGLKLSLTDLKLSLKGLKSALSTPHQPSHAKNSNPGR